MTIAHCSKCYLFCDFSPNRHKHSTRMVQLQIGSYLARFVVQFHCTLLYKYVFAECREDVSPTYVYSNGTSWTFCPLDDVSLTDVSRPQVKYGVRSQMFTWAPCVQLYSLAETPATTPLPPNLSPYTRSLLVSQDGRHLYVTPCTWVSRVSRHLGRPKLYSPNPPHGSFLQFQPNLSPHHPPPPLPLRDGSYRNATFDSTRSWSHRSGTN